MSLGEVHNRIILFNVVKSVFNLLMQCLGMFARLQPYLCAPTINYDNLKPKCQTLQSKRQK